MRVSLRQLANPAASAKPLSQVTSSTSTASSVPGRKRKSAPPPISLEHFIQRNRVLHLYRTILRSLYRSPPDTRREPIAYARGEFLRNQDVKDIGQIRYLISTGKTEFDGMQRYIDELASRGREN